MRGINHHINRQFSIVSYFLISALLFSNLFWPVILSKPKEAKAATGNLHLFWTGADAPDANWAIVSDGSGEAFYQRFIKGAASYGGYYSDVSTHTHTVSTNVIAATAARGSKDTATDAHAVYDHVHSPDTTVPTVSHLPPFRQLKVIEYTTGGVPATIPSGAIAIFDAAPPAGWTTISASGENYYEKFVNCYNDATTTGGNLTHTHSVTSQLDWTLQARDDAYGTGSAASRYGHTHSVAHTTSAGSNIPPYIDVILASKDSAGAIPVGMIGFFDDTLSYGWTSVSGASAAFDGKYIRGNGTYGNPSGALTHTHADSGYETSTAAVGTTDPTRTIGTQNVAWGSHTHAVSFTSFSYTNHEPPYIEVIFAKRTAVYQPEINNWRWYADEEDITPGTVYANENTAPPQTEMGKSIGFKLRVNFAEVGGVTGDNSRKKLQYATSTSGPWTEVGATNYIGALFRYYDGGGVDNDILSSTLITGSNATFKGIHDESNSAAPSNSDHKASTTMEFEYCIENYNAAANTLYYFNFNDEIAGEFPLASGKSYPSLTTASAYTLSLTSPSAVYFGSWEIGSSAYHEYTFSGGAMEYIDMRDNRGQTAGNSSGWTCSVEVTALLTNKSLETIPASDMYWTTNAITGYYDAPTTGMTGYSDVSMGSAITAVEAAGSGKQGLGGFYILPTIRVYASKVGDYSNGVLAFTIT